MLAADAAVVRCGVDYPVAGTGGIFVFEVSRTYIRKGIVTVEVHASGGTDRQTGAAIAKGVGQWDTHATNRIDQGLEGAEVDLHVVVGLDTEVVANGVDQSVRVGGVEGLVDATLPAAIEAHVEIALHRQCGGGAGVGVDAPHHDDVGAFPEAFATEDEGGVGRVGVDAGVVVGADQQKVRRIGLCEAIGDDGRWLWGVGQHRCGVVIGAVTGIREAVGVGQWGDAVVDLDELAL